MVEEAHCGGNGRFCRIWAHHTVLEVAFESMAVHLNVKCGGVHLELVQFAWRHYTVLGGKAGP